MYFNSSIYFSSEVVPQGLPELHNERIRELHKGEGRKDKRARLKDLLETKVTILISHSSTQKWINEFLTHTHTHTHARTTGAFSVDSLVKSNSYFNISSHSVYSNKMEGVRANDFFFLFSFHYLAVCIIIHSIFLSWIIKRNQEQLLVVQNHLFEVPYLSS